MTKWESGLNYLSVGMVLDYAYKMAEKGHNFVVENGVIYELKKKVRTEKNVKRIRYITPSNR